MFIGRTQEHIFYSAKECIDYEQLSSISEKILGKGKRFDNWEALFNHLWEIAKGNKTIASILQTPGGNA